MKRGKKLHRYAKAGHRSCQPNVDSDTSIQNEPVKYNDAKIAGKSADELNEEIAAKIDTCENDDNSLRIDFYPFAYSLHDEQLSSRCWYCLAKVDTLK
ncbi:hypothetical protein WUBG_17287 [Wuchereria bancrofti]|nr:hypothetical protein WUBG_17287 [Wuchereria bancrofti]